jgi:hypothetical protein
MRMMKIALTPTRKTKSEFSWSLAYSAGTYILDKWARNDAAFVKITTITSE